MFKAFGFLELATKTWVSHSVDFLSWLRVLAFSFIFANCLSDESLLLREKNIPKEKAGSKLGNYSIPVVAMETSRGNDMLTSYLLAYLFFFSFNGVGCGGC